MWDDLDQRLERCESRLREARRLLREQQRRGGETLPDGMLEAISRALVSIQDADRATERFCQTLRDEAERRNRARGPWAHDMATVNDLFRALGIEGPLLKPFPRPGGEDAASESDEDRPMGPDEEGPAGNAPVPAVPTSPPPLVGAGAARTFEEAMEPPRNP